MTAALSASMVALELAWSGTVSSELAAGFQSNATLLLNFEGQCHIATARIPKTTRLARRVLPLHHVGDSSPAEVADVAALRPADPRPPHQRVVHVTEQHQVGLRLTDGLEQRDTAAFHPARLDVIEELRHIRWDVCAEDVDPAQAGDFGGVLVVVDLVRRPHRRT